MTESGARVPGCQGQMVMVVTIRPLTVPRVLHYPCRPATKPADIQPRGPCAITATSRTSACRRIWLCSLQG